MPTLQTWLEFEHHADLGLLGVLALIGLILLWMGVLRYVAPKLWPFLRWAVLLACVVSATMLFALTVAAGGLNP